MIPLGHDTGKSMREIGGPERNSGQTDQESWVGGGGALCNRWWVKIESRKCHRALLIVEGQGRKSRTHCNLLHKDPWECGVGLAPPVSLNVAHLIGSQLHRARPCQNPSPRLGGRPQRRRSYTSF